MALPSVETAPEMPGPFELVDWTLTRELNVRPVKWELGRMTIHPTDGRPAQEVLCLRLHVAPADKPAGSPWYDITSKHAVSTLRGHLESPGWESARFKIVWVGDGPRGRPIITRTPA